MKKILLFVLLCASVLSYANDIIVTNDEKKLEVKITSVTKEQITYKMPDYIDGPDFIIETSEISTIIFENGQVKTYHHEEAKKGEQKETSTTSAPVIPQYRLSYDGNSFFRNGLRMENKDYELFLKENCSKAYDSYQKGLTSEIAGSVIGVAGITMSLTGIIYSAVGGDPYASLGILVPALALDITAIPCLVVGMKKVRKSADIYNTSCATKQTVATLNFTSGYNGLGLALSF